MAYARDGVKATYMTKSKMEAAGATYHELLDTLNDLYNSIAFYDGTEFRVLVGTATEQDDIVAALLKMSTDLDALKYKTEA